MSKKIKLSKFETVVLIKESNARLQNKPTPKLKDLRSFILSISFGEACSFNALCDTCASINLISLSLYRKLVLREVEETTMSMQLADRSI